MGPIQVEDLPYPGMLLETRELYGLFRLYGDTITITEPGNVWDEILRSTVRDSANSPRGESPRRTFTRKAAPARSWATSDRPLADRKIPNPF